MADRLVVRGAREHNLQDVSLDLPRDRLIVFTGLSGSGKSSLAFDTIYAEGQRRYVESLSAYARQFLGQMDKPDVDFIEGLSPAISIDQKSASRNPRSTVGTVTEVYDYLRLLYARIGKPHCPNCGRPVARQSPQQIVDRILAMDEGTRFMVLAPVVRGRKGEYGALLDDLAKQGFARARVDGATVELADRSGLDLARYEQHTIEVVVDRLVRRDDIRRRLTESLETALSLAEGVAEVVVVDADGTEEEAITFSQHLACTHCGLSFEDPSPRNFSFNSPYGACPACTGLGTRFEVDPELVVPDPDQVAGRRGPRPVVGGPQRVLQPDDRRRGRPGRLLARRPVGEAAQGGPEARPLRGRDQAGPPPVPQPVRPPAVLPHPLRGHRPLAAAAPHRGGVGVPARQPRGLPARGALPRVRRGPAPARVAGRHRRRVLHLRAVLPVHRQGGRRGGRPRPVRPRPPDRRPGLPRGPRADAVPARRGARLPDPGPLGGHPVGRRGPAHPAGQPDRQRAGRGPLRARRAVHRPAPARQPAAHRHAEAAARPGQHGHRGRARRGDHPGGRPRGRRRTGRGGARRPHRALGSGHRAGRARVQSGLAHRPVHLGGQVHPGPGRPAPGQRRGADRGGRPRAQPARHRRRVPARPAGRGDRRVRFGEVDAGQRHPPAVAGQAGPPGQGGARAPTGPSAACPTSTRWSTWTRPPSAARRGPTRPPTPGCSTTSAGCSARPRRPRSGATCPAGSPST